MPELPEDTTIVEVDGMFSVHDTFKEILANEAAKAALVEALSVIHAEQLVDALESGMASMLVGSPVDAILPMMIKAEPEKVLALINNHLIQVEK